ncbi:PEGA domain-containing protein [Candidatus Uhrbacteria bacterium]|nr:PEGA domain-containing protein [Candidatus Uhrbacteria bacterium]
MPLWLRRIIYYAFVALFLLVAPILALYSMGYRYHPGKQRIEATGLIVVDGIPSDALVRIDGVVRARNLPAHIGGLGANDYTVRIEREGFHSIEQRVAVTNGRTTFLQDVLLWRAATPALLQPGESTTLPTSADQHWASFLRTTASFTELWILDLRTLATHIVLRTPRVVAPEPSPPPIAATWSPTNAILLVTTPSAAFLVNPTDPQRLVALTASLPELPTAIQWELGDTPTIVAISKGVLYRIHRTTGRVTALPVPPPSSLPFGATRKAIYTIHENKLLAQPLQGDAPILVAPLPPETIVTAITGATDRTLTLQTTRPEQRIIIDLRSGTVTRQPHLASRPRPRGTGELRWTSPFELWAIRETPASATLLARREVPIIDAVWHPTSPHAVLATAHDIIATRMGDPTQPMATLLAEFDLIRGIAMQTDATALIIAGRRGTSDGVWVLPLQ